MGNLDCDEISMILLMPQEYFTGLPGAQYPLLAVAAALKHWRICSRLFLWKMRESWNVSGIAPWHRHVCIERSVLLRTRAEQHKCFSSILGRLYSVSLITCEPVTSLFHTQAHTTQQPSGKEQSFKLSNSPVWVVYMFEMPGRWRTWPFIGMTSLLTILCQCSSQWKFSPGWDRTRAESEFGPKSDALTTTLSLTLCMSLITNCLWDIDDWLHNRVIEIIFYLIPDPF